MRGDKATVQKLLQQKSDVNAQQIDGATALHWAVQSNDLQLADLLLRAGAKPAAREQAGRYAAAACGTKRKRRDDRAAAERRRGC